MNKKVIFSSLVCFLTLSLLLLSGCSYAKKTTPNPVAVKVHKAGEVLDTQAVSPSNPQCKGNPCILTLFSSESEAKNKVWIGTFQLVFNDMKNNIIKHNVEFVGEEPTRELIGLNNEEFNSDMLNPESYYTSYGETSPEARDKIKKDLKQKFDTKSDILDSMNWEKAVGRFYAYAMLKKEFDFLKEFDELDSKSFNNSKKTYKYFGIKDDSDEKLDKNLGVLFYSNPDDYAVQLYTKNNDIVYLYRSESDKDFKTLFDEMTKKRQKYRQKNIQTDANKFSALDTLMIPEIKFKNERDYDELCNKLIKDDKEIYFSKAIETIEFSLDKKGGKVKSEAALMLETCGIEAYDPEKKPRHFNFDKTFVMFLVDKGKDDPYMALRIKDLEGLQDK